MGSLCVGALFCHGGTWVCLVCAFSQSVELKSRLDNAKPRRIAPGRSRPHCGRPCASRARQGGSGQGRRRTAGRARGSGHRAEARRKGSSAPPGRRAPKGTEPPPHKTTVLCQCVLCTAQNAWFCLVKPGCGARLSGSQQGFSGWKISSSHRGVLRHPPMGALCFVTQFAKICL